MLRRAYRTAACTTPYVEQRQRSECTSHYRERYDIAA